MRFLSVGMLRRLGVIRSHWGISSNTFGGWEEERGETGWGEAVERRGREGRRGRRGGWPRPWNAQRRWVATAMREV